MKKNKLTTAVVAGLAGVAGVASISNAVNINHDGLGQVLLYPFYTVNNGTNTLFSVVNTTDMTKAVKVRFLEGDNTLEVLDFNLYLSPYDVWTAGLTATVATFPGHEGEPSGQIVYSDISCVPYLASGTEFRPFIIDSDVDNPNTPSNKSMERSTFGHFEMIEMGELDPTYGFGADAVHGSTMDCGSLQAAWDGGGTWNDQTGGDPLIELLPAAGGLFGAASLINPNAGTSATYNATAIDNFWTTGNIVHTFPGSTLPTLEAADTVSEVYANGVLMTSEWFSGIEAITALFMKNQIMNEYDLAAGLAGKTEWVVTFPTKKFHVDNVAVPVDPFTVLWDGDKACEPYGVEAWDREEGSNFCQVNPNNPLCQVGGVSPIGDIDTSTPVLCQEVNVIEFLSDESSTGASAITGTTNLATIAAFTEGWSRLTFNQTQPAPLGTSYRGLPIMGFALQQYTNAGAGEGLLAQYAGLFEHKAVVTSYTPIIAQ